MTDLVPGSFWRFPAFRSFWDDDEDLSTQSSPSGLSISEDEKSIFVEAHVPGVDPKDIEVTFDKGMLWIKGESNIEDKKDKKYYRKATNSFSYRIAVPGELDPNKDPKAACKNGVMTITFDKSPKSQPKKITVSEG